MGCVPQSPRTVIFSAARVRRAGLSLVAYPMSVQVSGVAAVPSPLSLTLMARLPFAGSVTVTALAVRQFPSASFALETAVTWESA